MSQFQLTPMSILDETAFGGFRAGMADQRGLMHSDSALETERLAQEEKLLSNEKRRLDTPMEAAERAKKIAEFELQQKLIADGTAEQGARADVDMKIANALGKMDENQRKRVEDQANAVTRAYQELEKADPAYAAANWDRIRTDLESSGVKGLPRTWSPVVQEKLNNANRAAWRTMKVLQDESMQGLRHQDSLALATHQGGIRAQEEALGRQFTAGENAANRANQLRIAQGHDATSAANARIMAENRGTKIGATLEEAERAVSEDGGRNASLGQLELVERRILKEAGDRVARDMPTVLERLQDAVTNPKTPKKEKEDAEVQYREAIRRAAGTQWERIQQLKKEKQGGSSGAAAPAEAATPSAGVKTKGGFTVTKKE